MANEQFSLCWDNFHRNMSSGMHSLLANEDLVDVTLAVDGQYLKAHKMVLSVCSPYFRTLFSVNPCKHPIVFLKDVTFVVMNDLLTFMYQGEVQVNQENLATFIKTAEALQIKGLTGENNDMEDPIEETKRVKRPAPEDTRFTKTIRKVAAPLAKRSRVSATPSPAPSICAPATSSEAVVSPALQKVIKQEEASAVSNSDSLVQYKVEPCEGSVDHSQEEMFEDEQEDCYIDDSVDDGQIDDSQIDEHEDYNVGEGDEPQAGTSGEAVADSQVSVKRYSLRIVSNGFVYHQNRQKHLQNIRYLICSEYKRLMCRARATMPINGDMDSLVLTKEHNHPPMSVEKQIFMKTLKTYFMNFPSSSLRMAYDNVKALHPIGSVMCPFPKLVSSMRRWKKDAEGVAT